MSGKRKWRPRLTRKSSFTPGGSLLTRCCKRLLPRRRVRCHSPGTERRRSTQWIPGWPAWPCGRRPELTGSASSPADPRGRCPDRHKGWPSCLGRMEATVSLNYIYYFLILKFQLLPWCFKWKKCFITKTFRKTLRYIRDFPSTQIRAWSAYPAADWLRKS